MYGSQSTRAWLPYICLLFSSFSNDYHSTCVWPTALKLGCFTNFDMLFLVMGFISLVDEIQFMLISSHICIRSMNKRFSCVETAPTFEHQWVHSGVSAYISFFFFYDSPTLCHIFCREPNSHGESTHAAFCCLLRFTADATFSCITRLIASKS